MNIRVADPRPVPKTVAVCPECGIKLWWQVTTEDGLRDLDLTCAYDPLARKHRYWQGEWEPVYEAVRQWITNTYHNQLNR